MVYGVGLVIDDLVNIVGAVIVTGVAVTTQVLISVIAHVPAATRPVEVPPAKFVVSLNFKWQL
jgi:hypothetical protein